MRKTIWRTPIPFGKTLLYADCVSPSTIATLNAASPIEQKTGAHPPFRRTPSFSSFLSGSPAFKENSVFYFSSHLFTFSPNSTGLKNSFIIDRRLCGEVTERTNPPPIQLYNEIASSLLSFSTSHIASSKYFFKLLFVSFACS